MQKNDWWEEKDRIMREGLKSFIKPIIFVGIIFFVLIFLIFLILILSSS